MKTFKDQDGKNVLIGPRGSAGATIAVEKFQALGIKPKILYTTQVEAIEMMKDRRADAFTYHSPLRWSGFLDIATARPLKLIPMTSEDQKKIHEASPYSFPDVIPAKTYDFQNEDISTMSDFACVLARPGIPQEIIYKLTKLMWDKRGELMKSIESLKWIKPEMVLSLNAPLHPGAAKYYREIGIKIPDQMIWKKE
jgi:TRAP transporter TAXI family solute receptor